MNIARETAISYVVRPALANVFSYLENGLGRLLGVEEELEKIKISLEEIQNFILVADRCPVKEPKLKKLLEKLKDAAYDAEDLLEDCAIEDRMQTVVDTVTNKSYEIITSLVTPFRFRAEMATTVRNLSLRLEAIATETYESNLSEAVMNWEIKLKRLRDTYSPVDDSQVFGREEEKEKLVNWLLSAQVGDGDEGKNVPVIPLVGMGGLGKTTLAKLAFNHELVRDHFDLRMWVCVSDEFDVAGLASKIIGRATDDKLPGLSDVEELQRSLWGTLGGKRFLLMLDDVWNEEPEKWYRLRDLLRCGGTGSRIVVTTRSPKVAFIMSQIEPQVLEGLSDGDCWSLFSRQAFGNQREEEAAAAHPELGPIGLEIVKKCKGNPLAVTTLGGILRTETRVHKWKCVRDSEMWDLADENEHGILPALRLSYNHLKPHLKQCFAFCAVYPKSYLIDKELLIKLWMANGFIPSKRGMALEDIGNDIFEELVMRSFFQDVITFEEDLYLAHIRPLPIKMKLAFRMHDLMHDLAESVMSSEYCVVKMGNSKDISPRVRHASIDIWDRWIPSESFLPPSPKPHLLRTYIKLREHSEFHHDIGLCRFLRALDLKGRRIVTQKQLQTSLCNLQHLRYLDLSFTFIDLLPESLPSLYYLQTLILRFCRVLRELPKEMSNLTNLRYLDVRGCDRLTHMPAKMGHLSCLTELPRFVVGKTDGIFACSGIAELQRLNLRGHLGIQNLKNITDVIDVQHANLAEKSCLTSLYLEWGCWHRHEDAEDTRDEDARDLGVQEVERQVLQGLKPHQNLEELIISSYDGINFPSWMTDTAFTNLVNIFLYHCWGCKYLPPLGQLPLLKVLKVHGLMNVEHIGQEFYGDDVSGGFPSLETFEISNMNKLRTWSGKEWKGEKVFPSLIKLTISCCPILTRVTLLPCFEDINTYSSRILAAKYFLPQGMLQNLTNLKSLTIKFCYKLEFFPMGLQNLTSLELLELQSCMLLSLAHEDELRCLSSLKKLTICHCEKLNYSGERFHYLSSLEWLTITHYQFPHTGNELSLPTSLQYLCVISCNGFWILPEALKNLTSLQYLSFVDCSGVDSLLGEMQHLTSLQSLNFRECGPAVKAICETKTGEDWQKIQHIPRIRLY